MGPMQAALCSKRWAPHYCGGHITHQMLATTFDAANRLVADSLEADWNEKLRQLSDAQAEYERQRDNDRLSVSDEHRARIAALTNDFPRLWQDRNTPDRERKRMVRLLIEDVTLIKERQITLHVRFRGGATQSLTLPRPLSAWELRMTPAATKSLLEPMPARSLVSTFP